MKQRFDLIGCEKVSDLGPVGRAEGYKRELFHVREDKRIEL